MIDQNISPYGSWTSPITTDLIVAETIRLQMIALDGDGVYWTESRPQENGRNVIVHCTPDGQLTDINPPPFNSRTRVHEYGGGDFFVQNGTVYFSNFADQRIYRQESGSIPQALTLETPLRYADGMFDLHRNRLICIREDHTRPDREAVNAIVSMDPMNESRGTVIVGGNDFYASPRLSPDGKKLCWITWNHPNMPWDGTELWVGEFDPDGHLTNLVHVAGGKHESIFQPQWSPDGTLYFVSDRSGWWNIYRWRGKRLEAICPLDAEFGLPQWIFNMSTYAIVSSNLILCAYTQKEGWDLAFLDTRTGRLTSLGLPYTYYSQVRAAENYAVFIAGSPTIPLSVVHYDFDTKQIKVLRSSSDIDISPHLISIPQAITYPTEHNQTAHAFFYPPKNDDFHGPDGEKPPLRVISHGGPTGATDSTFSLGIQYWTSRGIAVLDVNYGGSVGYGRAYRERLNGQWGVMDVDDCINGVRYLVERGLVDKDRLAISGGSAGGYTTLCALAFRKFFQVGASFYGVSDLKALAKDTHKFESRYMDRLVAPYAENPGLYYERSPIHHTENLSCPVILLQGLEDKVVPPAQAELIFEALRSKGIPVAYLAFEGEQHGFRRAETIKRALEATLYFYGKILGFEPADTMKPVKIENWR